MRSHFILLPVLLMSIGYGQSFFGAGFSSLPQSSPKPSGWAAVSILANKAAQVFSFSEMDFTPAGKRVQTSVRTGMATPLRSIGNVQIYGLADAGTATVGTSSGSAFSGGGIALVPVGPKGWQMVFGVRVLKTAVGGSQSVIEFGFGRTR